MKRFEKQQHKAGGHVACGVLFVLIATILATPVLLAQQPNQLAASARADEDRTIRPFIIKVTEEARVDLRHLAMTRWPDQETVADRSQGIQLANLREIVRHRETGYDWSKAATDDRLRIDGARALLSGTPRRVQIT